MAEVNQDWLEVEKDDSDELLDYNESPRVLFEVPRSKVYPQVPVMIAVPTTGLVRFEWHLAAMGVMLPVAFGAQKLATQIPFVTPLGFHVAEARNICVESFMASKSDWLFFIDHDVILHPMTYSHMLSHMLEKKHPIVTGLYYTKGEPSVPLVFRDPTGMGPFTDFNINDLVEVSGTPMGCTIIHRSILEYVYNNSRKVRTMDGREVKEVFRTPRDLFHDPETNSITGYSGTEDLHFCNRIINEGILEKTGWEHLKDNPYPFLCDTRIFCGHITQAGVIYPAFNPITAFMNK